MSLNLSHRHMSYNPDKPDIIGAYEDMANMIDRATGNILLLQTEFIAGNRSLDDSVIFNG